MSNVRLEVGMHVRFESQRGAERQGEIVGVSGDELRVRDRLGRIWKISLNQVLEVLRIKVKIENVGGRYPFRIVNVATGAWFHSINEDGTAKWCRVDWGRWSASYRRYEDAEAVIAKYQKLFELAQ